MHADVDKVVTFFVEVTSMAMGVCFVCSNCAHSVEAWDDGNPYYLDDGGKKVYAYHPDHEALAKCIGNDAPHLCPNLPEKQPFER
jgi:predicted lipoprotein with Yx(FWY)xxD motif